jgi:hypothetical protein
LRNHAVCETGPHHQCATTHTGLVWPRSARLPLVFLDGKESYVYTCCTHTTQSYHISIRYTEMIQICTGRSYILYYIIPVNATIKPGSFPIGCELRVVLFNVGFKGIGAESFICRYWWFLEGKYRSKQPSTYLFMRQICHILMHVYAHQFCVNLYMCSCACAGYNTYTKYACHCCQSCSILIFWMLGRCTFQMPIKSSKSTTEISYNHE